MAGKLTGDAKPLMIGLYEFGERCPNCRLRWSLFPPVKCGGSDHVRCVECKSVYPCDAAGRAALAVEERE